MSAASFAMKSSGSCTTCVVVRAYGRQSSTRLRAERLTLLHRRCITARQRGHLVDKLIGNPAVLAVLRLVPVALDAPKQPLSRLVLSERCRSKVDKAAHCLVC